MKITILRKISLCVVALLVSSLVTAEPATYFSQTVRGGTGLMQTPTARMAREGEFHINYNDVDEYRFMSVSLQLFPWMETTMRYTDVRTRLYSPYPGFSGDQTYKDKGIDLKLRLLEESYYLPDVSVGLMDMGGTGLFRSEYVATSKAYGPFDFHLGLGWGYLGSHDDVTNPFCKIANSFCNRPVGTLGRGGSIDYDKFFKGPMALFGGIEYRTPINGLRLQLEYEGNNYVNDFAGQLKQDTRWNVGAAYRWQGFDFKLSYQRGNTLSFGVSYAFNMHSISQIKFDKPPRSIAKVQPATSMATLDKARLYDALQDDGKFVANALIHSPAGDEVTIYGNQFGYRDRAEATERVGRILASELPKSVATYRIVEHKSNIPMLETEINADTFKSAARYETLQPDLRSTYVRRDPSHSTVENFNPNNPSGPFFNVDTFWVSSFGGPENFYIYEGGAIVNTGYAFNPNYSLKGAAKITLIDNYDDFNFLTDSQNATLPRVRTQIRRYVTRSNVRMENLYAHWFDQIAPNTYAQTYAGYLEAMFGGVGAEVLYRPVDSNLAFGVDLNYVRQRSWENDFDFFDYETFTGHANVYWNPDFLPDVQLSLNFGQFLAGDRGVNINFAKRFDSGIVVGAYAALTNASAEEFGEGSFNKGFYISIPLELFTFAPVKGRKIFPWVPITRDGGQMLNRPRLKAMTEIRAPFYD